MLVADPARQEDVGSLEARESIRLGRRAQTEWARTPLRERLAVLERFRHGMGDHPRDAARWVQAPWRRSEAETLAAEVLPLLEACRFLEENAQAILEQRRPAGRRPLWLGRFSARIEREPLGLVLVLGPANYPLFLPGTQTLQALAAGNAVLWKPGRFGSPAAEGVRRGLVRAGLPNNVLQTLPEGVEQGLHAIRSGVDKVVLTGSADTGRLVLAESARTVTPATMELSGVDACFVLDGADLDLAARALCFGLEWNSGFTCIAPRRVFADQSVADGLVERLEAVRLSQDTFPMDADAELELRRLVERAEAQGARRLGSAWCAGEPFSPTILVDVQPGAEILRQDPRGPLLSVVRVSSMEEALEFDAHCPYALGATIFGPGAPANNLARRVNAGMVVINDVIAPTADPRLPFGGRGASGFGVTRGEEGLLEMTRLKTVLQRRGKFRPHLEPAQPTADRALFESYIQAVHGAGAGRRLLALRRLIAALTGRSG